ncbi:thioredoxin family protein [Candidatus Parcubacteria bacterium]|nr:MAG: thioredoxin family protein [Candidatus Parcubacteria bacterium]
MFIYKKLILGVYLLAIMVLPVFASAQEKQAVEFFWQIGCPHCAKEEIFLDNLEERYGDYIEINRYEISRNSENLKLLEQFGRDLEADVRGVPFTVVGEKYFMGYLSDETTGADIEAAILESLGMDAPPAKDKSKITLPVFGELDTKSISLPVVTIILGALDGFNPCAMWVLLFLISLLLGIQDRRRMWVLGVTFIVASSAVYFLFMAAWLNLILFLGFIIWIRILIGLVSLGGGAWNLKKYFKNKDGGCEVTGDEKRRRIFDRLKEVTQQKNFWLAFVGIITLAFAVNLVEAICSAGLPAVFTQLLVLNNLPTWQYYAYILLYIFFFMLDDMLIFVIAMFTLKMTGISTKYSRWSNLIGGILMIVIGLLLIFKPEWLLFG